jgi:Fe-S cluster biogenesis protein NfuA/nitrite reductase/ring-hydroxylating ferredoxin subunit
MADDVGQRVEELLGGLRDEDAVAVAEQIIRLLVDYYGAGLARVVEIVGPDAVHELTRDPLVESQLVLHGLHPLTVDQRIERALDRVRPYLGSHAGGVSYDGVDPDGVARLTLSGSCHGCPSSTVTVHATIESAVLAAAPEVSRVEVAGQVESTLLQIGRRPGLQPPVWQHPAAPSLPADGRISHIRLDGRPVLLARLGETLYAYADSCPGCGGAFGAATLSGEVLSCADCPARYDLRLAGKALDSSGTHLEPLPLLDDASGIRIALQPEVV